VWRDVDLDRCDTGFPVEMPGGFNVWPWRDQTPGNGNSGSTVVPQTASWLEDWRRMKHDLGHMTGNFSQEAHDLVHTTSEMAENLVNMVNKTSESTQEFLANMSQAGQDTKNEVTIWFNTTAWPYIWWFGVCFCVLAVLSCVCYFCELCDRIAKTKPAKCIFAMIQTLCSLPKSLLKWKSQGNQGPTWKASTGKIRKINPQSKTVPTTTSNPIKANRLGVRKYSSAWFCYLVLPLAATYWVCDYAFVPMMTLVWWVHLWRTSSHVHPNSFDGNFDVDNHRLVENKVAFCIFWMWMGIRSIQLQCDVIVGFAVIFVLNIFDEESIDFWTIHTVGTLFRFMMTPHVGSLGARICRLFGHAPERQLADGVLAKVYFDTKSKWRTWCFGLVGISLGINCIWANRVGIRTCCNHVVLLYQSYFDVRSVNATPVDAFLPNVTIVSLPFKPMPLIPRVVFLPRQEWSRPQRWGRAVICTETATAPDLFSPTNWMEIFNITPCGPRKPEYTVAINAVNKTNVTNATKPIETMASFEPENKTETRETNTSNTTNATETRETNAMDTQSWETFVSGLCQDLIIFAITR